MSIHPAHEPWPTSQVTGNVLFDTVRNQQRPINHFIIDILKRLPAQCCVIVRSCVSGAKRDRTEQREVSAQPSLACTTDICQTNADNPISEDRLVALGNRQEINDTVKIAMRMKGAAMPILECGRRWRPGAEVQA
jgi:hypothetical protein